MIKSLILPLACILSSYILGSSLIESRFQDRTVVVKGLAEQEVTADLAMWSIPLNYSSDNLENAKNKIERDSQAVIEFLTGYGIAKEDIEQGIMKIHDKLAQRYYDAGNKALRYNIYYTLNIKSNKIDAVASASQNLNSLIKKNISLSADSFEADIHPKYIFTQLNTVKPQMLADATQEARKAAQEFASNSNSKIGKIKRASQGVFSIFAREAAFMSQGMSNESHFIKKTVRVVTTVEYYLDS